MAQVLVQAAIRRPIADVFLAVSDHERFLSALPGTMVKVIRPGAIERDGLGCLREVRVGSRIRYVEEITLWDPPHAFEYLIREASIAIRHYGSRLDFAARDSATDVVWKSHFDVPLPVVGWPAGVFMKLRYQAAFSALLARAKATLEGTAQTHGEHEL